MIGLSEEKENSEINRFDWSCLSTRMLTFRVSFFMFPAGEIDVFDYLCKNDYSNKPYFLYFSNSKRHNYISFE